MSLLLSIALAGAAITPAAPVEPNGWFNGKDQPKTALMVAERGPIAYRIDVSPEGKALRCETQGKTDVNVKPGPLNPACLPARPSGVPRTRPPFA